MLTQRDLILVLVPSDYYLKEHFNAFLNNMKVLHNINIQIIGNTYDEVDVQEIYQTLINKTNNSHDKSIIIFNQGFIADNQFFFKFKSKVDSKTFFTDLTKISNNKIDLFVSATNSGKIVEDKDFLPIGSVVASSTSKDGLNSSDNIISLVNALKQFSEDTTAYNLLELYLLKSSLGLTAPIIGISGEKELLDLNNISKLIGESIAIDQKQFSFLKTYDEKINYLKALKKVNVDDVNSEDENYGMKLAIMLNFITKGNIVNYLHSTAKTIKKEF